MQQKKHSHWVPLTVVIAGLIIGYSAVIFMNDASAEAGQFCPVEHLKTVS